MKRANGTGSIVKLSGSRRRPYAVRVSCRDESGRVIQSTLSYHAKIQEAQAALDDYNQKRLMGQAPAADRLNVSVQQIFDAWSMREYKKMGQASINSYNAAWNKRVSVYKDRKFRSVSLDEWQKILDDAETLGKSQSTINNATILIKALHEYAMRHDIIGKDYSAYLDIPSVDIKMKKGALTEDQLDELKKMSAAGFPWADTALILCYTGLRISEFLSLTPESYHNDAGGYVQCGMKTEAGRDRIIPIHPEIAPYISKALSQRDAALFTHNAAPMKPSWYRENAFPAVAQRIGVPEATPHWCRHTFATRLHAAGCDPLAVKWLMGHSTRGDMTARYTHKTVDVLRREILLLT